VQYVLGFIVPLLLAEHVTNTRVATAFYGGDFGHYENLLTSLWYNHPLNGILQMALLLAAWTHACIGLRFWLRLRPWYDNAQPLLYAAALLVPVIALLGYIAGGREIAVVLARDPAYLARTLAAQPPPEARPALLIIAWSIRFVFVGSIALVLIARMVRHEWWRRKGVARVSYPDGRSIEVVRGLRCLRPAACLACRMPRFAAAKDAARLAVCMCALRPACFRTLLQRSSMSYVESATRQTSDWPVRCDRRDPSR
jgi:adenylate cyclase